MSNKRSIIVFKMDNYGKQGFEQAKNSACRKETHQ